MGISLGLVGLGSFGSQFAKLFKAHPDVDRIALCDSEPEKVKKFLEDPFMADKVNPADCYATLAEICQADLDGLVIITQPWLHAPQCIEAMQSGKHVYSAVPLITIPDDEETLEWAAKILQTSRSSGCQYMLGETTIYRAQTMFCRRMAAEGAFGEYVYSEGEYVHDVDGGINGGSNLRKVLEHRTTGVIGSKYNAFMEAYTRRGKFGTPMNYPTHSIAGPINVMQTRALKVSAYGTPNSNNDPYFKHDDFTNISALYQLANGSSLRISELREVGATSIDRDESEIFRIFGKSGSFSRNVWQCNERSTAGTAKPIMETEPYPQNPNWPWKGFKQMSAEEMRDPLPQEVQNQFKLIYNPNALPHDDFQPQGHGGSHPYLVHEFVNVVKENRPPLLTAEESVHYMAMAVAANSSARKEGEIVKVQNLQ